MERRGYVDLLLERKRRKREEGRLAATAFVLWLLAGGSDLDAIGQWEVTAGKGKQVGG